MSGEGELYVHRWGDGPRAIFAFHGWSGDHRTFQPLASRQPSEVSLFAFDQPGFGRSSAPAAWNFDAVVEPMRRYVELAGLDAVELVGNCSGAFTALRLALQLGAKVRRVVLIDAFAFVPWYFRWLCADPWGALFYRSTFANPFGRYVSNLALARRRASDTHLTQAFTQVDHGNAHAFLKLLCSQENVKPFAPVTGAIDLVYGARSFEAVRESIALWQEIWPHARAHRLEGAGHLPIEEATAELAEILFHPARAQASVSVGRVVEPGVAHFGGAHGD